MLKIYLKIECTKCLLYGIEQEYTLFEKDTVTPLGWLKHNGTLGYPAPQGPYYCAVGTNNIIGREIVRRALYEMFRGWY